jgi:Fe2+ transport system protein B
VARTKTKTKAETKKEKELEKKIEKMVEKKVKEAFKKRKTRPKTGKSPAVKIFGEIVGYIIFLLFLFVIFPKFPFVTSDYSLWQPIAFWTTTIGTFLKVLKHGIAVNDLQRIFEMGEHIASIYSTYWLIVIYPLDFALVGYGQVNYYFRIALYFVIFALSIAILVNFIRIFFPEKK